MAKVTLVGNPALVDRAWVKYIEEGGACGQCGCEEFVLYVAGDRVEAACANEICSQPISLPGVVYTPVLVAFEERHD